MFSIDENNKIKLTIGDTASFNCTIVDNEEKTVPPVEGDSLVMYIDSTDFEKEADITNNEFVFTITGDDMTGINTGVYMYRVVLNDVHTIIQDCFIDLLQGLQEEEPTPEPEPEPEPEPQHEHEYVYTEWEYDEGSNPWTHSRTGTCSCGDVIHETEPCEIEGDEGWRRCLVCNHYETVHVPSPGEHDEPEGF